MDRRGKTQRFRGTSVASKRAVWPPERREVALSVLLTQTDVKDESEAPKSSHLILAFRGISCPFSFVICGVPLVMLVVVLPVLAVWWYGRMCSPSHVHTPTPFPPHFRSFDTPAALGGGSVLDIVFVSAFPHHLISSLRSVCHFLVDDKGLGSVHLIVPDSMLPYFQDSLPNLQCPPGPGTNATTRGSPLLRLLLWPESKLVPQFSQRARRHESTVRQMTLKLAAHKIVESSFFLVMDSDVYARRPFRVSEFLLPSGPKGSLRAQTGLDQLDFPQHASWFLDASSVLGTTLAYETDKYCAAMQQNSARQGAWFSATGNSTPPVHSPFKLQEVLWGREGVLAPAGAHPTGPLVYGACRGGRGHATHVTPMVLSRDLIRDVLIPRLGELGKTTNNRLGESSWVDVLLDYQGKREASCLQALFSRSRFYTWTEYSLYFIAGVASGALDQYHDFSQGGITSFSHSIMLPEAYDIADWGAVFSDTLDPAPFFIVHSWFNKPVQHTNAMLARYIPSLRELGDLEHPKMGVSPEPSSFPLYRAR